MTEPQTLEGAIQQTNDLRRRILQNEPVSKEELKAALQALRAGRSAAASASTKSKKSKEPSKPKDLQGLFNKPVQEEQ